jgi:hypothetical protein
LNFFSSSAIANTYDEDAEVDWSGGHPKMQASEIGRFEGVSVVSFSCLILRHVGIGQHKVHILHEKDHITDG